MKFLVPTLGAKKINANFFCTKFFDNPLGHVKNPLMPLFLMGCFPVDFQEVKRPLRAKSVKRPIKAGKRPINEGKRPIKAKVLVGVSVGCLMGCFRAPPPWRKTAPLKRPIKRSMIMDVHTENRGRPHQKVRFPAAPVVGRNFLTRGHSGVRVRNVRGKSGPKSLCLCCFFFPDTFPEIRRTKIGKVLRRFP